jgi:hypothetical protein
LNQEGALLVTQFLDLNQGENVERIWTEIASRSPEAWFWSSRAMHEFQVAYARHRSSFVCDRSFAITRDGNLCGLAPLVFIRNGDGETLAAFPSGRLPWPMVIKDVDRRGELLNSLFDELERRVKDMGAGMMSLMLSPPVLEAETETTFYTILRDRSFVDCSFLSHLVTINDRTLGLVRERYRRDVRKYRDQYALEILSGSDVSSNLAQAYMDLHVKDAGKVNRPLETYELQARFVSTGEGFWVRALHLGTGRVAGMLLVSVHKNAAYDNSVAVDPDFAHEPVSHLMKWRAIESLIEKGVSHYELGPAAISPTYLSQPSKKSYGISFFKDGWSRGQTKIVHAADKFYSEQTFDRFWAERHREISRYFSIDGGGS